MQSGSSASAGVRGWQGAELSQPGLCGHCPVETPGSFVLSSNKNFSSGIFHLSMKGNEISLESEMQRNSVQLG